MYYILLHLLYILDPSANVHVSVNNFLQQSGDFYPSYPSQNKRSTEMMEEKNTEKFC